MELKIKKIDEKSEIPAYQHEGDAGMDLTSVEETTLYPGQWRAVNLGLAIAIPEGCVGFVNPRSGLAKNNAITVLNSPGTLDSSFRGICKVILINLGDKPFIIHVGDRIAQLVVVPFIKCEIKVVDELDETERNERGFGSSGV